MNVHKITIMEGLLFNVIISKSDLTGSIILYLIT